MTTRGEQLDALKADFDEQSDEEKQESVFVTAALVLMGEVDRDVALSVFQWAREAGIEAPDLPTPTNIDRDALVR
jgi:hypothetical protein